MNAEQYTTGLPLETLKRFTDPTRHNLRDVIHIDGFAYATDGLILVKTTSTFPDTQDLGSLRDNLIALANKNTAENDSALWERLPTSEARIKTSTCCTCGGTGKSRKCPSCDGDGVVQLDHGYQSFDGTWKHDDYECDCHVCEGHGSVGGSEGEDCEDCEGTGKHEQQTPIRFDPHWIDLILLNRIKDLPGVQIHPNPNGGRYQPLPLRGEGWTGALMPCRGPEK